MAMYIDKKSSMRALYLDGRHAAVAWLARGGSMEASRVVAAAAVGGVGWPCAARFPGAGPRDAPLSVAVDQRAAHHPREQVVRLRVIEQRRRNLGEREVSRVRRRGLVLRVQLVEVP